MSRRPCLSFYNMPTVCVSVCGETAISLLKAPISSQFCKERPWERMWLLRTISHFQALLQTRQAKELYLVLTLIPCTLIWLRADADSPTRHRIYTSFVEVLYSRKNSRTLMHKKLSASFILSSFYYPKCERESKKTEIHAHGSTVQVYKIWFR